MPYSSDSGQTEPIAALVAVFALGAGLSIYVGVLDATLPLLSPEHEITPIAAERLTAERSSLGAIHPPIDGAVADSRPSGHELNATLRADGSAWSGGPTRPDGPDCLQRSVSVRVGPGQVRRGVLEVCTWPVQ